MRNMLSLFQVLRGICSRQLLAVLLAFPVFTAISGDIFAQEAQTTITGTVTEASSGEPLPGVSIVIKGTATGTITDMDGNYSITAASNNVLVFSFIGYLNEEIAVGNSSTIDVSMVEDIIGLDEVVVTGYGVQKKSDLTGAVASVSGEELSEMPSVGVDQALQGRAAGVNVTSNTGVPGGAVQIQIRGISSVNGTGPLVIVDGVPASINDLNPNDIQSMEILKDASSAAIYGSTGGNGVILITTKKGKEGKITTDFSYYRGWGEPWKKIDMLNSQQYVEMRNYNDLFLERSDVFSEQPDTFENYDYQDIMFRTAIMEQADFSIRGGNEISTYYLSTHFTRQQGIMENSDYQRFGFRLNSDHQLSKILKVGQNAQFTNVKRNGYDEWVFQNEYNSPLLPILQMYPYIPPYDEDGEWVLIPNGSNPVVARDVMYRTRSNSSIGGNVYADLTLFKGFVVTGRLNGYLNNNVRDEFNPYYEYSPTQGNQWNDVQKHIEQQWGWTGQLYATYNTTLLDNINISAMFGYERVIDEYADMEGERRDLIREIPEYRYFDGSSNDTLAAQIVQGGGWQQGRDAYFGRLNADYQGKYLMTVNVRRDRSSRFGPDQRVGVFPSFSVGWKFSEEEFVKDLGFVSFGKIRFGYGETGANAPDRYAYYASINSSLDAFRYNIDGSINPYPGATLERVPNPELAWETVIMSNLGIDLAFLQNRLSVTVDLFRKRNDGMIIESTLPSTAGYYQYSSHQSAGVFGGTSFPLVNAGSLNNEGIEVTLGWKESSGDFKYSVDFNSTFLRNEVTDINGDSIYRGAVGVNLSNLCLTAEGYPVSQFNGYETVRIFQEEDAAIDDRGNVYIWNQPFTVEDGDTSYAQPFAAPGDFQYKDQNGDGVINTDDRVNIGSPIPKFIFGFSTNMSYKNFDLNLFLDGKFGHKIFNGSKFYLEGPTEGPNRSIAVLDQYRSPVEDPSGVSLGANTGGTLPRQNAQNYSQVSDYYVESGNYVRLKNVQIGYTLPENLTGRVGVEKFRIYVGARNLLTLTKYKGFDPEIGSSSVVEQGIDKAGNYPHSRVYLVGVNLQF